MGNFNTHTTTLTGTTLDIDATDNVLRISILAVTGTVTVLGSTDFKGVAPTPVTFTTGQGMTVVSPNTSLPVDGLTIDATAGTADVIISTQ